MNRKHGTQRSDLKKYMEKNARRPLTERYANFQLLLYLSREMDIDVSPDDQSALEIANCIRQEAPVSEVFDELIKSM